MGKEKKTLTDRVAEMGRATAERLGLVDGEAQTWIALREAIEHNDQAEIDRLQARLGIGTRHIEFCQLAVKLDRDCQQAAEAWDKAQARLRAIDAELQALRNMTPQTVKQAAEIGQRFEELAAERNQCLGKQTHEALSGVRGFVPELWGLPSGPKPSGCHSELLNFAQEHFDLSLYTASWLDTPRLSEPKRRVKVVAAG